MVLRVRELPLWVVFRNQEGEVGRGPVGLGRVVTPTFCGIF